MEVGPYWKSYTEKRAGIPDCWEHSKEAVGYINDWEFLTSLKFSGWPDSPSWNVLILTRMSVSPTIGSVDGAKNT
jgi:hypothetical protein